jgi:hypothetical protein
MLRPELVDCYAVPGSDTLIDMIDPTTDRTCVYGRTLEDVQREDPGAVRMTYEAWAHAKAARQNTPITWAPTTAERYQEMLDVLPPAAYRANGFLVGEPWDHETLTGAPRYQAFRCTLGRYSVASRPLTRREFLAALEAQA